MEPSKPEEVSKLGGEMEKQVGQLPREMYRKLRTCMRLSLDGSKSDNSRL